MANGDVVVVGAQEKESKTVNIRNRDDPATQAKGDLIPLNDAIKKLVTLKGSRADEPGSSASRLDEKETKLRALAAQLGKDFDEL